MKKMTSLFFTALLIITVLFMYASAAESVPTSTPSETIGISVIGCKEDQECFFEIKADNEEYPLPENAVLSIIGEGCASFGEITFPAKLGIYTYTIEMAAGNDPLCVYDEKIYTVTATVLRNKENGYFAVYTIKDVEGEKVPEAAFSVEWKTVEESKFELPKTGSNGTWLLSIVGIVGIAIAIFVIVKVLKRKDPQNAQDTKNT